MFFKEPCENRSLISHGFFLCYSSRFFNIPLHRPTPILNSVCCSFNSFSCAIGLHMASNSPVGNRFSKKIKNPCLLNCNQHTTEGKPMFVVKTSINKCREHCIKCETEEKWAIRADKEPYNIKHTSKQTSCNGTKQIICNLVWNTGKSNFHTGTNIDRSN